ncbi:MAG: AMP-binding protein, partial [Caedimonadaceae bacterium]
AYSLTQKDKILQKTPYIFDVSVWELFWANWYGACIVFAEPEKHKDANYIINFINKHSITTVHFVPSMLSAFQAALSMEQQNVSASNFLSSLRYIFCSGEALSLTQVQQCHRILPNTEIHNLYGPTEASVDVLFYDCTDKNIEAVYIGKQIDNTTAYVLDSELRVLPVGAVGELYIGGVGLARGYLNKPELTAERFISNPFQTAEEKAANKNARLYKTGDLVRWLPDGNLEYIGRNDFQVKIRGYRIELGEIESILSSYAGITQSVVLAKEHKSVEGTGTGNKYLVGYYVAENKLNEEEILSYLSSKLPDYMVPSILVHLEKIPLTINGKLDRKALPDPEFTSQDNYVAPRNELEEQVCQIWAEVLGLAGNAISIHDDFFRLGGDSIVSIQLVSKLRQRLGLKNVSVKDIFTYRSVERLYDNVLSKQLHDQVDQEITTEQGLLSGSVALLPIQAWFFEREFAEAHHWNQSFLLKTPKLDLDRLQGSLEKLTYYHDSLRLRYKKAQDVDGNKSHYTQYYCSNAETPRLQTLDINSLKSKEGTQEFGEELHQILTHWQRGFNLEEGPLYGVGYIHGYADGSSRVYFALHHLIVDSVSWRILAEDLRDLYNGKDLDVKGSSYRQWVAAVREYGETHENEKAYWGNVLSDCDRSNKQLVQLGVNEERQSHATLELSKEQTQRLLKESHKAYNTQINDILLTALGYTLSKLTHSKVNHVVLEGHGREEIDPSLDITRTVGWFTTMYPVRLEISEEFGESVKKIKETLRQIPNKGIGYGALLGYASHSLPRVSFNYLGQFDQEDQRQQGQGLWEIVDERSGESVAATNRDYNILNINGLVIGGKLKFTIDSKLDQKTTETLAQLLKTKLENLISYTASYTRSYSTVSDIGNIISKTYLDKLQKPRELEGVYLANSLQQGFISHVLNQGEIDDAYLVQFIWQYNSFLEVDKL